jgi:hypothetical protein
LPGGCSGDTISTSQTDVAIALAFYFSSVSISDYLLFKVLKEKTEPLSFDFPVIRAIQNDPFSIIELLIT